jgi:uncharacterized membrane protein YbaN (DUF454 family)
VKLILVSLGWLSVVLGVIGVFIPLLPTTPFLILAAFLFSKSSPRFYSWLMHQPYFGKLIQDWSDHGVIRLPAKRAATFVLTISYIFIWAFISINILYKCIATFIGVFVLIYIWSRPSV